MERRSPAIILHTISYGEADRLVTFFTRDFGKLKGVAKNAKKSNRRFGGGLEPGTVCFARFVEKNNQELVRLEDTVVERPAWLFTGSLNKILSLQISIELADLMLPLAQSSPTRYELLTRWIQFLSENEPTRSHLNAFFYKWLDTSGLAPVFDKCVQCGKVGDMRGWPIDIIHGGTVCNDCSGVRSSDIVVSPEALEVLQGFKSGKMGVNSNNEVDFVMESFIISATGRPLNSMDVAKRMSFK